MFVTLANFVVDLYVRGVARAAVDEAARSGAALDATAGRLPGAARATCSTGSSRPAQCAVTCREVGGTMRARARVVLAGWIPGIPTWTMDLEGEVTKERVP